jgi:hypothetical protein
LSWLDAIDTKHAQMRKKPAERDLRPADIDLAIERELNSKLQLDDVEYLQGEFIFVWKMAVPVDEQI